MAAVEKLTRRRLERVGTPESRHGAKKKKPTQKRSGPEFPKRARRQVKKLGRTVPVTPR